MALSINWATKRITIPKNYLTNISGTLYELDTELFRSDLKLLEESVEGMVFPDIHKHNTEVTIAGNTYARFIEIINGYSIEFEDDYYSVVLKGSNNNLFDIQNGILIQNHVQVIPTNSAGLIVKSVGSGLSEDERLKLMSIPSDPASEVWDESVINHLDPGSFGKAIEDLLNAGGSLTPDQADQLKKIFQLLGLDLTKPTTHKQNVILFDDVEIEVTGDNDETILTRKT